MSLANLLFKIKEYINYRLKAKGIHSIHSPFLFDLYKNVINNKEELKDYYAAEAYREELLNSEEEISRDSFGAGPSGTEHAPKLIKSLSEEIESSGVPPKLGQLLYRLVQHCKPHCILELGTNAGISTLYMLLALRGCEEINFHTIEGCKDLFDRAKLGIEQKKVFFYDLPEVHFINGSFEKALPKLLKDLPKLDFVFIDGDHRKEKVLQNFSLCASKSSDKAVFVIDDIRWSEDMLEAWNTIVADPRTTMTLDLFNIGIVFFEKSFTKQNFLLKW